jgi:hypothetical protein
MFVMGVSRASAAAGARADGPDMAARRQRAGTAARVGTFDPVSEAQEPGVIAVERQDVVNATV